MPIPSLKSIAPPSASRCCIPTTIASSPVATDAPLPQAQVPVVMLDDIESIANVLQAEALPREQIGKAAAEVCQTSCAERRLMAQLSDDCFAFNGPLLPVADAERLIAERVTPVGGGETVPLREALGRVLADDIVAPVNRAAVR